MAGGAREDTESALRVLSSASDEIEALRRGSLSPSAARGHILRVADAVDRSLRRLLRDDEGAELPLRLKALAPDEMRIDNVLAELRRNERVSMELAASLHELLETRRRLEADEAPEPDDAGRAVAVTDRLEAALRSERVGHNVPLSRPADARMLSTATVGDDELAAKTPRARRRGGGPTWLIPAAAVVVLAVAGGIWALTRSRPNQLEQGIALFQDSAYADAASYFFRYAQENPEDVTPHLYLARIHRRMNRPQLAADALREAQERAPNDPAVHRETGFLLLDSGRPDVAIGRFRTAIEMDPESMEGWIGLVRALRNSGQEAEVAAVLQQAPAEVRALLTRPTAP